MVCERAFPSSPPLFSWKVAVFSDAFERAGIELPPYDRGRLLAELALFPEWFLDRHLGRAPDGAQRAVIDAAFELLVASEQGKAPPVQELAGTLRPFEPAGEGRREYMWDTPDRAIRGR